MSNLKQLYFTAKHGKDVSSYVEAVQNAIDKPMDYILNLEYIISSDVGLKTLKPFIEKNGFPIPAYESTMELLEKCINKCEEQNKDSSLYKEAYAYMESVKDKYRGAFDMFDYYIEDVDSYIKTYYASTNGKRNNTLPKGMYKKFAEASIPDFIMMCDKSDAMAKQYTSLLESLEYENDPELCEWLSHACGTTKINGKIFQEHSLSSIVEKCKARNQRVYRESVIMNNDVDYTYTPEEYDAINKLISFKEFVLTGMDESKTDSIMEAQREIYSLYEEMDGLFFEEDDRVGEKEKEELVPIYGLLKSYNAETADPRSVSLKKKLDVMTKGDNYSHAVVSFDDTFKNMYSFESNGVVEDSIDKPNWMTTDSIYMCVMYVPKSDYENMKKFCKHMVEHKDETKYGYSNMIKAYISKPVKKDKRFICSTFVAFVLQGSNPKNLHRDYSRMRPEDITILPRSFYLCNCKNREDIMKRKNDITSKTKSILKDHQEELDDYNNHLPKILLKDRMTELKTFDKLLDYFMSKA